MDMKKVTYSALTQYSVLARTHTMQLTTGRMWIREQRTLNSAFGCLFLEPMLALYERLDHLPSNMASHSFF